MPEHTKRDITKASKILYDKLTSYYGLREALKVTRLTRGLLRDERERRKLLPGADRETFEDPVIETKSSKDKTKKKKKKGPGLFASLCILFDKKGVKKVTYSEAKKCAKLAKPDSDLSQGHYKWYLKQYKKKRK